MSRAWKQPWIPQTPSETGDVGDVRLGSCAPIECIEHHGGTTTGVTRNNLAQKGAMALRVQDHPLLGWSKGGEFILPMVELGPNAGHPSNGWSWTLRVDIEEPQSPTEGTNAAPNFAVRPTVRNPPQLQ